MALNIRQGGGPERTPRIGLALRELGADVVALSEYRAARGGQLRAQLADGGLTEQAAAPGADGGNGVLVASRWRLTERAELSPPGWAHRCLGVELAGGVTVVAAHVPDATNPAANSLVWRHLVEVARVHGRGRCVVVGDFNTARRGVDGPQKFRGEDLLGAFCSLGFRDVWRERSPGVREATWEGPWLGASRLDAAYVSAGLEGAVRGVGYDHSFREQGLSDHSAVVLDLEVEAGGGEGGGGLFGGS